MSIKFIRSQHVANLDKDAMKRYNKGEITIAELAMELERNNKTPVSIEEALQAVKNLGWWRKEDLTSAERKERKIKYY